MNSKQIEQFPGFLGQKLAEMQMKATILLLGGAVMVTQIGNRKATFDIDIVVATNDPATYRAVQQAARLVAQEKNLSPTWLNDDVTIIIDQVGRPKAPKQWKIFSNSTVFVPELEYILALKLFSGRQQDTIDIRALARQLQIETKEDAWSIVNSYIPTMQLTMRLSYTEQAIDRCFVR
jgi:hypothetical protein